jgi:hypothetical protein
VTELDVPKFMRLRTAVRSALDSVPSEASSAFRGLVDAYQRLRAEAKDAIGEEFVTEFDALFPSSIELGEAGRGLVSQSVLLKQQEVANTARTLLGQLAGSLDGFIEAASSSSGWLQKRRPMRLSAFAPNARSDSRRRATDLTGAEKARYAARCIGLHSLVNVRVDVESHPCRRVAK